MNSFFAVTALGLEQFTALELRQLGFLATIEPGGVTFAADKRGLYLANLHLRTSTRILARVGQFFYATTFADLRQKAAHLPWERFLITGSPISIRVTCHKSKLIHSDAVAERIIDAISDRLGKPSPVITSLDEETSYAQLIVVRVANDQVVVSVDSSGEPLYKRGYRQAIAKAPLRETLAAGIILSSGWDVHSPLIDPFCGSGTIPIEAAMMALKIPPGLNRNFSFMKWPDFEHEQWKELLSEVKPLSNLEFPIFGSDRDAGAIKMSRENAARAGVENSVQFECLPVSAITPPQNAGWIVTNPPYGLRISEGKDLRNLYAQFGNVLREKCPGWNVAILSNDASLLGQVGVKLDTTFSLLNGGVGVRLGKGIVAN